MNVRNIALKAKIHIDGQYIVTLQGRCMEPLLFAGDKACVIPLSKLEIGNMYLFELPDGNLAAHRLIEINADCLVMKGDRSKRYEKIQREEILGEVCWISFKETEKRVEWSKYQKSKRLCSLLSRKMISINEANKREKNKHDFFKNVLIILSACKRKKLLHMGVCCRL